MRDIEDLIKIGITVLFVLCLYNLFFGFGKTTEKEIEVSPVEAVTRLQNNYDVCNYDYNKCSIELEILKSSEPYQKIEDLNKKLKNKPSWFLVIFLFIMGIIYTIMFMCWAYPIPKKNKEIEKLKDEIDDLNEKIKKLRKRKK